jgi:hypothetical protein
MRGLGSDYKEDIGLMNGEEPLEIEIASSKQAVGAGYNEQIPQGVDLVSFAVADMNKCWYGAARIEQGVQFHGRFVCSKRRALINRQTPFDRRRVQVVRHRVLCIQRPRTGDQILGEVGVDLSRPCSVGIGQGVARNRLVTQPHVIERLGLRAQVDLVIAQRSAVGNVLSGKKAMS